MVFLSELAFLASHLRKIRAEKDVQHIMFINSFIIDMTGPLSFN